MQRIHGAGVGPMPGHVQATGHIEEVTRPGYIPLEEKVDVLVDAFPFDPALFQVQSYTATNAIEGWSG